LRGAFSPLDGFRGGAAAPGRVAPLPATSTVLLGFSAAGRAPAFSPARPGVDGRPFEGEALAGGGDLPSPPPPPAGRGLRARPPLSGKREEPLLPAPNPPRAGRPSGDGEAPRGCGRTLAGRERTLAGRGEAGAGPRARDDGLRGRSGGSPPTRAPGRDPPSRPSPGPLLPLLASPSWPPLFLFLFLSLFLFVFVFVFLFLFVFLFVCCHDGEEIPFFPRMLRVGSPRGGGRIATLQSGLLRSRPRSGKVGRSGGRARGRGPVSPGRPGR
jgi:hypothetical protein